MKEPGSGAFSVNTKKVSVDKRWKTRGDSLFIWLLMIILPVITAFICLAFGRYNLSINEVFNGLWNVATQGKDSVSALIYSVLINTRLPRIFLAVLCGAGLSVAGLAFQNLFANALATPDTLGVASGASLGAVLGLFFKQSLLIVQLFALAFGVLAVLLTYMISRQKRDSIIMVVLSGIVVSSIFNALISLLKFMADTEDQLPAITYWLMGSLANGSYDSLILCAPFIITGTAIIFGLRWRLNILCLSEDEAKSQGINIRSLRIIISFAATLITAASVSMCGQVGWVGLLIPHISRMIFGSNNQHSVPASICLGAVFMLVIDTVARSASSVEIPISILTALIGAPFFIALLRKTGGVRL